MQAMRDLLRSSLARSLASLSPLDRLSAAWPVAAGHAIAERSNVAALDGGTVTVAVESVAWQSQLRAVAAQLRSDLARISHVPLTDILFVLPTSANQPAQPSRRHEPDRGSRKRP